MEKDKKISPHSISRWWLIIGVWAVAIAGLYSTTLLLGRVPVLSNNPEIKRIFADALVVHVDLSVLVWFLSIACLLWSIITAHSKSFLPGLENASLITLVLAILCMMLSPFMPGAEAYKSNYIPMISSPLFMLGLAFVLCSVGFMLVKLFTSSLSITQSPAHFGIISAGWITLISIVCFFWSYRLMPSIIEGEQYFDLLFWGGGHVLQLTHTQMVMVVWLAMSATLYPSRNLPAKLLYGLFGFGVLAAFISPLAYFLYDVTSSEFRQFFTHHMIAMSGVAPGILSLILVVWMWQGRAVRKGEGRAVWSAALVSMLLFLYGGALGLMITGQNVVIPAHYHGSIVGITLAFMGYAYLKLPDFGYRHVAHTKLAYWQPIIYGLGQVMHVSGLAYSGGYGVLRKTAGGVDNLTLNIKIALGVMGLGGVLALAGGLIFIIVMYRAMRSA